MNQVINYLLIRDKKEKFSTFGKRSEPFLNEKCILSPDFIILF